MSYIYRLLNYFSTLYSPLRGCCVKVVGRAMSTYGSRMLIIQCDAAQLPGLYSEVMDRRTKLVGKILDVFGSVKSPYALVLSRGPCNVKAGEKVYVRESHTPTTSRVGSSRITTK